MQASEWYFSLLYEGKKIAYTYIKKLLLGKKNCAASFMLEKNPITMETLALLKM